MIKKIYVLSIAMMLMLLSSCNDSNSNRSSSFFEPSKTEDVKEEVKEAEKKPVMFYQRLLEQFCQRYYNSCFNGREYHNNSLIVDNMKVTQGNWENGNIISWDMMIEGRHSFEGRFKNHNDSPFYAFVDDNGDNEYQVTFFIKRYDIFGDQMSEEESATRTITYYE